MANTFPPLSTFQRVTITGDAHLVRALKAVFAINEWTVYATPEAAWDESSDSPYQDRDTLAIVEALDYGARTEVTIVIGAPAATWDLYTLDMTGRHWDAHRVQSFAYQSAQDAAKSVVKDANNLMETWYASRRERTLQTE